MLLKFDWLVWALLLHVGSPTEELQDLCHIGVVVVHSLYKDVLARGDHGGPWEILQADVQ